MRTSILCIKFALSIFMLSGIASAQTVIEALIENQEPCGGLRTEAPLIGSVGVDRLEKVRVPEVNFALRDDELSMSMTGRLACKTSENAALAGSASARIKASLKVDIASCKVFETNVELDDFGGEFGSVISAFQGQIAESLSKKLQSKIIDFCMNMQSPE